MSTAFSPARIAAGCASLCLVSLLLVSFGGKWSRTSGFLRERRIARRVAGIVASLTPEEKASQTLMTGIDGKTEFPGYLYGHFRDRIPGAILLFRYNIADTPEAVASYIDSCDRAFASLGARVPVLYAIDHEGGDVYRTGSLTTRLPSARSVAERFSAKEAERLYEASGAQLSGLGIKMNLAPVAEVSSVANGEFLGTRAFSGDADIAVRYTRAALWGYGRAGVLTVLKHFPGNGPGDPHLGLPRVSLPESEFRKTMVDPFRAALNPARGPLPDAILVSHIVVDAVDPGLPFCLSRKGVTGLLRGELSWRGLVLTDDVAMGALAKNGYSPREAAVLALRAGCDMVMTSDPDIGSIVRAIADEAESDPSFAASLDRSVERIVELKLRAGLIPADEARPDAAKASGKGDQPRAGTRTPNGSVSFDPRAYAEARRSGDRILEEKGEN